MRVFCKWRSVPILQPSTFLQSLKAAESNFLKVQWTSFHSTDASFEKGKDKFNFDVKSNQQPSKSGIRYEVREKRANSKKALKNLLLNAGSTSRLEPRSKIAIDYEDQLSKKSRIKPVRQARRAFHKKMKRNHRRESLCDDFEENSDRTYKTRYGHRYEWAFRPWEMGYDWKETSSWGSSTSQEQYTKSNTKSDDECFTIGACSDRRTLGLPTTGPLKIEDVKIAFRRSALLWHPDRHQGSTQAAAEERFKNCASAYKSLCNAFSAT